MQALRRLIPAAAVAVVGAGGSLSPIGTVTVPGGAGGEGIAAA